MRALHYRRRRAQRWRRAAEYSELRALTLPPADLTLGIGLMERKGEGWKEVAPAESLMGVGSVSLTGGLLRKVNKNDSTKDG